MFAIFCSLTTTPLLGCSLSVLIPIPMQSHSPLLGCPTLPHLLASLWGTVVRLTKTDLNFGLVLQIF